MHRFNRQDICYVCNIMWNMKYGFTITDMEKENVAFNKPAADNHGDTFLPFGQDPELPVTSITHPHHWLLWH